MPYKQSQPIAARREMVFHLTTSGGAPDTGKTFSGAEIQVRKPGASSYVNAANSGSVVEIGGGDYVYTFSVGELDTAGTGLSLKVSKGTDLLWTQTDEVTGAYFCTAQTGTLGVSAFTTSRTEADHYWRDTLILALDGPNAGQVKKIGDSAATGGLITLATINSVQLAFSSAPVNGNNFEIIDR